MNHSLDEQRAIFCQNRFLAMPLTGAIVWALIGIIALFADEMVKTYAVWFGCGSIFYLAIIVAKFTGEDFFGKHRPNNPFDRLFMGTIVMCLCMFAIVIPFATYDHTAVPLGVGILAGLMWIPFSWIIQHWVGYFHAAARTIGVLVVWYLFPEHRFEAISLVIVVIYVISIYAQERRYTLIKKTATNIVNSKLDTTTGA
ncbi:DUF7010 family protein [Glaciecola petra]|uniref:Permease n=1 Tax=Glaciecola petra TaxID=3075602 RepID=A0ABU2ZUU5_9ALTE|nr:hypothetical protein [Aestuariibacter sp. P117]MDT0596414.1 hypothetical protein [Aestuariibacter sp. P117]